MSRLLLDAFAQRARFALAARETSREESNGLLDGLPVSRFADAETSTQGYFVQLGDAAVFAFRGTEFDRWRDVLTDAMFWKKSIPYGNAKSAIRVHSGFLRSYKSVRATVHACFAGSRLDLPIVVVGHSLGGALATLAAVDLQYQTQLPKYLPRASQRVYLFTYGSPRVGNAAFARSFGVRVPDSFRFAGTLDAVTKIPILGYQHVAREYSVRGSLHKIHHYLDAFARRVA